MLFIIATQEEIKAMQTNGLDRERASERASENLKKISACNKLCHIQRAR